MKLKMKNRLFQIVLFVLFVLIESNAQGTMSTSLNVSLDKFASVDEMPRFPGCEDIYDSYERERCSRIKLSEYIKVNLDYPEDLNLKSQEAMAMFIVDKTGSVSNIKILQNDNPKIIECAKKALASMSDIKWIPGKRAGKPENIWFMLPIKFDFDQNNQNQNLAEK